MRTNRDPRRIIPGWSRPTLTLPQRSLEAEGLITVTRTPYFGGESFSDFVRVLNLHLGFAS